MQDLHFAARTLAKVPGSVAVILTLALATGATTAVFSIVNGVLLRPLPFAAPVSPHTISRPGTSMALRGRSV